MSTESQKVQNVPCSLLSAEENQKIFCNLGKQRTSLATTVVELYLTEGPYHLAWVKKHCGVLCFVKDYDRRSFFIKLFDIDKSSWVWEQELNNKFLCKPECTYFHVFEADKCMARLNFADNDECFNFLSVAQKKIEKRNERKRGAKSQPLNSGRDEKRDQKNILTKDDFRILFNFKHLQHVGWHQEEGFNVENANKELEAFFTAAGGVSDKDLKDTETRNFMYDFIANHGGIELMANDKDQKRDKKKILAKDDIGTPKKFEHLQHVGWHQEKGFNVENADKELKAFFTEAGVSDKDLKDTETRNFIYDFTANHGGIAGAKQEAELMANGKDQKRDKKKILAKDDIGTPKKFAHVQHVGWHPEKGFHVENVDKELEAFFNEAGVSNKNLKDSDTRNFIYDFIENHSDEVRAKQETEPKSSLAQIPTQAAPQTPRSSQRLPPALLPLPTFCFSNQKLGNISLSSPPPPMMSSCMVHKSRRSSSGAVPPFPPPPPAMGVQPPPPGKMPVSKPLPPPTDNMSAQLDQFKKERELYDENVDKELEAFCNEKGVSYKDLKDFVTRISMYDFLVANAKQEAKLRRRGWKLLSNLYGLMPS